MATVIGGIEPLVQLSNGQFARRTVLRKFSGIPALAVPGPQVDLSDGSRADSVVFVDINGNEVSQ